MRVYGDIDFRSGVLKNVAFENLTDFPAVPVAGQTVFKNKKLYLCSEIQGQPVWIPMTNEIDSMVHVQDEAAAVWTIDNTFSDNNVMVQVFDETGSVIIPESIEFGLLTSEITFGSAQAGRAVIIHRIQDGTSGGVGGGGGGGASAMADLTDVLVGTPADGDVLVWDDVQGKWVSNDGLVTLQTSVTTAVTTANAAQTAADLGIKKGTLIASVTVSSPVEIVTFATATYNMQVGKTYRMVVENVTLSLTETANVGFIAHCASSASNHWYNFSQAGLGAQVGNSSSNTNSSYVWLLAAYAIKYIRRMQCDFKMEATGTIGRWSGQARPLTTGPWWNHEGVGTVGYGQGGGPAQPASGFSFYGVGANGTCRINSGTFKLYELDTTWLNDI